MPRGVYERARPSKLKGGPAHNLGVARHDADVGDATRGNPCRLRAPDVDFAAGGGPFLDVAPEVLAAEPCAKGNAYMGPARFFAQGAGGGR